MILSDRSIREAQRQHSIVTPYVDEHVQPASVDLTLGNWHKRWSEFKTWTHEDEEGNPGTYYIGGWEDCTFKRQSAIYPGTFLLASTVESVNIPDNLVAQINGKSSWARKGLIVHTTAGFIDPGFSGQITLELKNVGHEPIVLTPGIRICQIVFTVLSSKAEFPYGSPGLGSHYQGQQGTTESALLWSGG